MNTYAWFFDLLGDSIPKDKSGKIVKYLGDGVMAVFDEEHPADAINWAIVIQEKIVEAQETRHVFCDCSIAITYGKVVEFNTPDGMQDYIGTVVDKAFRLAGVANAKAIFVDTDTIIAAPMHRVQSRVGMTSMPRRTATTYQGTMQSVKPLKGFSQPVAYHEILWASSPFGIRKEFLTNLSTTTGEPELPPSPPSARPTTGWSKRGRVISAGQRFGFIRIDTEDFWFSPDYWFRRSVTVKVGDEVWFNPLDSFPGRKNRRAGDVLPLGAVLDGTIEKVIASKGYAFVCCTSDRGVPKSLFLFVGQDNIAAFSPGIEVEFTVSENNQGVAGVEPRLKGAGERNSDRQK